MPNVTIKQGATFAPTIAVTQAPGGPVQDLTHRAPQRTSDPSGMLGLAARGAVAA